VDPVRAAARERLRTAGACSLADLGSFLAKEGHAIGNDLEALDEHLFPYTEPEWSPTDLHDGRLADTDTVLDGIVLTTQLTDADVAVGAPRFSPDLDPLVDLFMNDRSVPLATGGALTLELVDGEWELDGPPDWMPGAPGDLLVLRLADGNLHASTMAPDDVSEAACGDVAASLASIHDMVRERLAGVELSTLVIEVRVRHPRAWSTPVLPLGDLVERAGLALHGDWVAYPDELDDDTHGDPFADLTDHLIHDHGMTEEQADDFVLLHVVTTALRISPPRDLDDWERNAIAIARLYAGDPTIEEEYAADPSLADEALNLDEALPRFAELLADDDVAGAVPHDMLTTSPSLAGPLAVLTRRVARHSRDRYARSNAWWLHAQALEYLDEDGLEIERALRQALQASSDHTGAAVDLAWCLDDRGQAGAALGELTSHGLGDTDWADELRGWNRPGPTSAGRNDACPCGSGRKHKVCCGPRNGWPLIDRVDWVFSKLARFAARPANAAIPAMVGVTAGLDPREFHGLPDDPVVASMCVFEGGVIADMCQFRGALLPADELDLLRQWEEVTAGVYEVVETDPGRSMVLLDLRSGDRHDVTERTASQRLEPGTVLLTWLVPYPDGTTRVALGAVPVPVHKRASLLAMFDREPDAEHLASWYASLHAPPRMHNTDGDPMVMCEVTVAVPGSHADTAAALGVLDGFEDVGDGVFHRAEERDDGTILTGAVRITEDGHLVLEANSSRRADALIAAVQEAIDGAEVIDDVRTPIGELLARASDSLGVEVELGEELPSGGLDLDAIDDLDPEEADALRQAAAAWIEAAEERWCDEPIPALGGLTPRQAVDDPTRRGDLLALLDEMPPVPPGATLGRGFDPDRLRALLGLGPR
jgi:hypothetical protein